MNGPIPRTVLSEGTLWAQSTVLWEVDEDVWIGNKIIEVWRKFDAHWGVLMEKLTKDFNFDS